MSMRIICLIAPPLASLALVIGIAPAAAQGTEEERRACTPDVMRLCREYIPEVRLITQCLIVRREELSPDCKLVMRPPQERVAATTPPTVAPKARIAAPAKTKKKVASAAPSGPLQILPASLVPPSSIPQKKAARTTQQKKKTAALPKSSTATAPKPAKSATAPKPAKPAPKAAKSATVAKPKKSASQSAQ